jgi:predicted thioesterase
MTVGHFVANMPRRIGDGTHRRGIVNVVEFEKRFGVKQPHHEFGLDQSETLDCWF